MNNFSLYTRMLEFGTIAQNTKEVPDVKYALPSTIHWMRALAILSDDQKLNFKSAKNFYAKKVQRKNLSEKEINSTCEQLLFALNQLASLHALADAKNKADVARIAIMAWYYGVYGCASAMIAANDGSFPDNHSSTAVQWDRQFSFNELVMPPFSDRISNLLDTTIKVELAKMKHRGAHSLLDTPRTAIDAWSCLAEYFSGTTKWEQGNIKEKLLDQNNFKVLGVTNFRTKEARVIRDIAFQKKSISFIHEAIRYRGKANYRDAIYLAYGKGVPKLVVGFVDDLVTVLTAFSSMAAGYVATRMGENFWQVFINDLEEKRSISLSPKSIWS